MPESYGQWFDFCRDSGNKKSTIPVCNLFPESPQRSGPLATGYDDGCNLNGILLSGDRQLANLGSILLSFFAIILAFGLLFLAQLKKAAVGRREFQLFLLGYALISLCEIFTVGHFPLNGGVVRAFSAIHIGAVTATTWLLLLQAIIGYQFMEDGTPLSLVLCAGSAAAIFIGTGYIALDTGFSFTHFWKYTLPEPNQAYALYTLYLLIPLVFIVLFFLLETFLVARLLGETRPLIWLSIAGLSFAVAQIFQFVASNHICDGTHGRINGGMFSVLFTLIAVGFLYIFWSSITEDEFSEVDAYAIDNRSEIAGHHNPSNLAFPHLMQIISQIYRLSWTSIYEQAEVDPPPYQDIEEPIFVQTANQDATVGETNDENEYEMSLNGVIDLADQAYHSPGVQTNAAQTNTTHQDAHNNAIPDTVGSSRWVSGLIQQARNMVLSSSSGQRESLPTRQESRSESSL